MHIHMHMHMQVRRPLIGVHVRLGDGCYDSKRGGCKYVRSFEAVIVRLRQAGLTTGTIFLATDNSTIAAQAVATKYEGFDVLALAEDRKVVETSHSKGLHMAPTYLPTCAYIPRAYIWHLPNYLPKKCIWHLPTYLHIHT